MARSTRTAAAKQLASTKSKSAEAIKGFLPKHENGTTPEEEMLPKSVTKKRKRSVAAKIPADPDELPHGLGKVLASRKARIEDLMDESNPIATENCSGDLILTGKDVKDVKATVEKVSRASTTTSKPSTRQKSRNKANPYGVTLGITPYPDWSHPTPEECHAVNDILSKAHGEVKAPQSIPLPSLTVAGCGEVPHILDAMMRTLLSAHTTNKNAGAALEGLVKTFGVLQDGPYKGSIDWNVVRLAPRKDIEEAIKRGGLAKRKSTNIEQILHLVYQENQTRRAALEKKETMSDADSLTAKILEDPSILTLNYYHALSMDEAFKGFIKYPGIGVKTASCILLFCMQKPSFAVDTHVWRLCTWLGWVPQGATRDSTFAHCDVKIPNELKYSLHQLLIKHGKQCGRCRAITGEGSEDWSKGCPLEELVKRTGEKKGGKPVPKKATKAGKKLENVVEEDRSIHTGKHSEDSDVGEGMLPMAKKQKKSTKATALFPGAVPPPRRTRKAVSKLGSVPFRIKDQSTPQKSRKTTSVISDDDELSDLSASVSNFDPDASD
ncbi:MAG: hypothetical protein MMC33_003558 [Icmadophila ericetorum]|nr:hypothetical protein [Icmadophila ericetorum]